MTDTEAQNVDLIRLVQHVALNESGWWDRAIERLTLACSYLLGPSTHDALCAKVTASSGVQINSQRLLSAIEKLLESGSLVNIGEEIQVAEEIKRSLRRQENETLIAEDMAYEKFGYLAHQYDLENQKEELWTVLETDVILPIIRHIGAQIYGRFFSSSSANDRIGPQVNELYESYGDKVRRLFTEFMNSTDDHIKGFVLRRLNAQYILDAAALPGDALDRLANLNTKPSRIDIFLDTNVLLYCLDLRHSSGERAVELLKLADQLRHRINLQFYVLPITVEETKRVIRGVISSLEGFRGQRNFAKAALLVTQQGIASRYFEEVNRSSIMLTAQEFFGPYESDLLTILRDKSIELYNTDLESLRTDQNVIDDIHHLIEKQENYKYRRVKSYEANLHDMVLWHFTSQLRGTNESPFKISSWIVTLDYGLRSFDKYKHQNTQTLPICLDPASLIHMFQFWIPSSSELDEALVGSLRHPLLFLDFDIQSEQITIKILGQLSRYIGAEDLSPEVVREVLINSTLRERISGTSTTSTEDSLPMLDFSPVLHELNNKLKHSRLEIEKERSEYENEYARRIALEDSLTKERKSKLRSEEKIQRLTSGFSELKSSMNALKRVNEELEIRVREQDQKLIAGTEDRRVFIGTFITVIGSIISSSVIWAVISRWWRSDLAIIIATMCALFSLLWGLRLVIKGTRFTERPYLRWLVKHPWLNYTITTLLSIGSSLIANWLQGI